MSIPLAYFLTWTCYGTWLHGDERGSVDREHNLAGRPFLARDDPRRNRSSESLKHWATTLDPTRRRVVKETISSRCAFLGARLLALSVRSNHVHLVVSCNTEQPGRLAGGFKSRCTRVLRERGLIGSEERVWTKMASTRYLRNDRSVEAAIDYVTRHQGPPDEFTIGPQA